MKIFVIGSKGLLGSEVMRRMAAESGWEVVGSDVSDADGMDITKDESIAAKLDQHQPNVVINCAAFTNVDACETEDGYKIAKAVNADGPAKLAQACKDRGISFFHLSTDYVFGGKKEDGYDEYYTEYHALNKYAETKVLAEQEIIRIMGGLENSNFLNQESKAYIVRTSWLFGVGATNFIAKILELAKSKDHLEVVTDEVSSPTYVKDLAERMVYIIQHPELAGGVYHASGVGHCSRFEFAKEILKLSNINTPVEAITSERYPRKTKIPEISYLLNTKLPPMRPWQEMLKDYLENS